MDPARKRTQVNLPLSGNWSWNVQHRMLGLPLRNQTLVNLSKQILWLQSFHLLSLCTQLFHQHSVMEGKINTEWPGFLLDMFWSYVPLFVCSQYFLYKLWVFVFSGRAPNLQEFLQILSYRIVRPISEHDWFLIGVSLYKVCRHELLARLCLLLEHERWKRYFSDKLLIHH